MAWMLGTLLVVLWCLQGVTLLEYGSHYGAVTGYVEDGPEAVGGVVLALLIIALTPAVAAWLWWILKSYPQTVSLFAWCRERPGRSLLWSLWLGGYAVWCGAYAVADFGISADISAIRDLAAAGACLWLRGVVVSSLVERHSWATSA